MAYETLDLRYDGTLARLHFTQSERGNPMDGPLCRDLLLAATEIANRGDVRALLITSGGRFFSVGGDIQAFMRDLEVLPQRIRQWTADLHMALARLARLDVPIVAAAHATAMGGSLALIANCDLVFGARSARFGSAYAQLGYSCDAGATFGLASRMGIGRARRFVLLAEVIGAEEAEKTGLIDFMVDDTDLLKRAEEAALKLADGPTRAYGEIRRLFRTSLQQPFEAQLEDEAQALIRLTGGADAREGIAAFAGRRKPQFKGL
ncbi:enoyl-CoA hydratase/isomerase family protein [Hydrocarboniphaga sp.]|uniref:enoyl-CoA hydratase/isomerase family protein n=1 Tax=Hydrocarboniphaga sp. TaxID=2033016 RepID=UPI003D0C1BA3